MVFLLLSEAAGRTVALDYVITATDHTHSIGGGRGGVWRDGSSLQSRSKKILEEDTTHL